MKTLDLHRPSSVRLFFSGRVTINSFFILTLYHYAIIIPYAVGLILLYEAHFLLFVAKPLLVELS